MIDTLRAPTRLFSTDLDCCSGYSIATSPDLISGEKVHSYMGYTTVDR